MYPLHVITSDKYIQFAQPWIYLTNKFWQPNPEIVLLCNKLPDWPTPSNVKVVSLGDDTGPESWGPNLANYLDDIDYEYVPLFMEDCWITDHVDIHHYKALVGEALKHKVDRLALTISYLNSLKYNKLSEDINSPLIRRHKRSSNYQLAFHVSLWKPQPLAKYSRMFKDPWSIEQKSDDITYSDGFFAAGAIKIPFPAIEVAISRRGAPGPNTVYASKLPQGLQQELDDVGMLDYWKQHGDIR